MKRTHAAQSRNNKRVPLDFSKTGPSKTDASSPASYLVERSLHTFAGVVGHILEGPAQSAQTVVGSVARPVHQVGVGLLSHSQIKPVHQHKLLQEAHRVHMCHVYVYCGCKSRDKR